MRRVLKVRGSRLRRETIEGHGEMSCRGGRQVLLSERVELLHRCGHPRILYLLLLSAGHNRRVLLAARRLSHWVLSGSNWLVKSELLLSTESIRPSLLAKSVRLLLLSEHRVYLIPPKNLLRRRDRREGRRWSRGEAHGRGRRGISH